MNNYKTIQYKGHTIKINYSEWYESPREWDNIGKMICWHRNYNLGDKHNFQNSFDLLTELARVNKYGNREFTNNQLIKRIERAGYVILPLYLYDHSGITMRCSAFSCSWDSGQVGYIYAKLSEAKKDIGIKNLTRAKLAGYLESEVQTYDMYLTGEIYGFTVENKDGEHIDSCGGYFGSAGIEQAIDEAKHAVNCEIKRAVKKHIEQVKNWIKNKVPIIYRKPLQLSF